MAFISSLAILAIAYLDKCSGFNLDTNYVDIIESANTNDYFGYSVLLQKGSTSSVLVGAPKANSSLPNYFNIKEPGVLYKCDLGTPNSCKQYVIDREGNSEFRGSDRRYNYKNKKDGSLLGATIDGGENVGDPFVVCSPRWVNDRTDKNGQHYLANGMCYRLQDSRNLNEIGEKLMPLLYSGNQGYTINNVAKYYYATGEVGMSVQYLLNKEKTLLLGAPGVLNWKGSVVRYQTLSGNFLPPRQRLVTNNKVNVPNPVYISNLREENSYFGYAISSGIFDRRYSNLWYVAGAPRAEELYGLVLVYEFSQVDDDDLIVHRKLIGEQMGSYFGGALLSIDINGNGVDDLLVGAPTYFTEMWDEGCVYYYKNDGQGNLENPLKIFGNKKAGIRFGTTISSLGDINQDSYQDVAIAAPYEDKQGAVYIYLGGKNGLNLEFSQKISAKTISSSLRGFGFSISKGVDVDQNLYNDIAVGAYKSGKVTIIKSRPVIKYFATLSPSMKELSVNTTNFNVTYCISYKSTTNTVSHVATNIQIVIDSKAINNNNNVQTVTLTKDKAICKNIEIMLRGGNSDFTKPFTIETTYSIADQQPNVFCSTCPVTDPAESKSVTLNIPFANGCGDDNICQPDLHISANFENNLSSLIIGSATTLYLNIRVENRNEPAYLCQVHMKLPSDVEILRISSKCELTDDRMYTCLVDSVLQPNTYKELIFDLDIKKLNPQEKELLLNLTVGSKGEEINLQDNSILVVLPLNLKHNIEIAGKSFPHQIVYVNEENKIKSEVVNFTHEFTIKNLGPSPLLETAVHFYFPVELDAVSNKRAFDIFEPEVYLNNQLMECSTDYSSGFFTDDANVDGGASDIDDLQTNAVLSRLRRNSGLESGVDSRYYSEQVISSDLPINRTVFVNCSSSNFKCMHIICKNGEIMHRNQYIRATFSVRAHIDILQKILNNKDIVVFSSTAGTEINGKTTQNYVKTLLMGSLTKEEVSYWIYIVCVIVGLIILAILIFVLYKLNFFNRAVREKLKNESENSSSVRELNDDDHESD